MKRHWKFLIAAFLAMLVWLVVNLIRAPKMDKIREQFINETMGDVEFRGRVISVKMLKHSGRPASIMCIKIDSCNVDSFYYHGKYGALRIHDGIATLPLGSMVSEKDIDPTSNSSFLRRTRYVEVNQNKNHQMLFIDTNGDSLCFDHLRFGHNNPEADMYICDTCR